jgi:dephospho-CoA kinase
MTVVGLTGGIGSGKTTVAKAFEALQIPVYIADIEAKQLMQSSTEIREQLLELLGEAAYVEGRLNRAYIAGIIFKDKAYLEKINAIVHPQVAAHFENWAAQQNSPYVIKEVAILFENGGHKHCDFVITVTAPKAARIARVLKRDETTKARVEAIMNNQWEDAKKIEQSHFVIHNTTLEGLPSQVKRIHTEILSKIQ